MVSKCYLKLPPPKLLYKIPSGGTLSVDIEDYDYNHQNNVSPCLSLVFIIVAESCLKVHMFSNAQNISIRDIDINNVAGNMTIIHIHITYHEPEWVFALSSCVWSLMTDVDLLSLLQTSYPNGLIYFL